MEGLSPKDLVYWVEVHRFVAIDLNTRFLAEERSRDSVQRGAPMMAFR